MIGTLDFETDPFLYNRIPQPFAGMIYTEEKEFLFWGEKSCVKDIVDTLYEWEDEITIYAHNGGKFDFHYLIPYAEEQEITVINGRVAKIKFGNVTLIDSFLMMPFALEQYKKTKIDYKIFEKEERNKSKNKKAIISYLRDDCRDLFNLVTGFHERLGVRLTIGEAAFAAIKRTGVKIPRCGKNHDTDFRKYYYGGRCEAFKTGIFKGEYLYIDINSAYPRAMEDHHPTGKDYVLSRNIPKKLGPQFISLNGVAKGCFPFRAEDKSLFFPNDNIKREYHVTGWELSAALDTETLHDYEILTVQEPENLINFKEFVRYHYNDKLAAKMAGDRIGELASKYLLNSGYGKFATDPEKFKKWFLKPLGIDYTHEALDWEGDIGDLSLWSIPDYQERGYYDVATAASITGWVRAYLWRSICNCHAVLYCDTDSIICKSHAIKLSTDLGDWKLEDKVKEARIVGKKLYSLYNGKEWKTASKGVKFDEKDILAILKGETVFWENQAPSFKLGKNGASFVKRSVKKRK